jgi:hypothetical protein
MARQGADPQRRADPCFGLSKLIQSSLHGAAAAVHAAQCRCQQQQYRTFRGGEYHSSGRAFSGHAEWYYWSDHARWRRDPKYGDNDIDGNTNNNTSVLTPLPML